MHGRLRALALSVAVAAQVLSASGFSQWPASKTPGIPRTNDGRADFSAAPPRTSDGKPDLSGLWMVPLANGVPKYVLNLAADLPGNQVPLQPWAEALLKERMETSGKDYPASRCLPPGVPNITFTPHPFKIIQMPGLVVILHEALMTFRQIFTDGRASPEEAEPTWLGYSVGTWEGNQLVV
jgi:hypothetical protein